MKKNLNKAFWLGKKLSKKHKESIRKALKGKLPKNIVAGWNKGKKTGTPSKEARIKSSKTHKKRVLEGKHNNYKGGITKENHKIRDSVEYKLWRDAVFERDNFTCIWCGAKSGKGKKVFLNADHIKPFAYYTELRFAIDNGRTLCVECHRTTETFGKRCCTGFAEVTRAI